MTEILEMRKDIQTDETASADSPTSTVTRNPSVVGDNLNGYREVVQVVVTYKWTYP